MTEPEQNPGPPTHDESRGQAEKACGGCDCGDGWPASGLLDESQRHENNGGDSSIAQARQDGLKVQPQRCQSARALSKCDDTNGNEGRNDAGADAGNGSDDDGSEQWSYHDAAERSEGKVQCEAPKALWHNRKQ